MLISEPSLWKQAFIFREDSNEVKDLIPDVAKRCLSPIVTDDL